MIVFFLLPTLVAPLPLFGDSILSVMFILIFNSILIGTFIVLVIYCLIAPSPDPSIPQQPAVQNAMYSGQRLPRTLPYVADKNIKVILLYFSDPNDLKYADEFLALERENPDTIHSMMETACSLMIRQKQKIETAQELLGIVAATNLRILCKLRSAAYEKRPSIAPDITPTVCECGQFLKSPCPMHPNKLHSKLDIRPYRIT